MRPLTLALLHGTPDMRPLTLALLAALAPHAQSQQYSGSSLPSGPCLSCQIATGGRCTPSAGSLYTNCIQSQCGQGYYPRPDPAHCCPAGRTGAILLPDNGCNYVYCAQNTYQSDYQTCTACPANSLSPPASSSVFQCACLQWFKANDTATTRTCVACPVCLDYQILAPVNGTFCGYACQNCSQGYYKNTQSNLCLPCQPGASSDGLATACTPCPAGSVAPNFASPACSACAQGTAAYYPDRPCITCNASQYVPAHLE